MNSRSGSEGPEGAFSFGPGTLLPLFGLIATRGRELIADRERFSYRAITLGQGCKERLKVALHVSGVDADEQLLGQLKRKRMELASERRVPAYVIFSDRSLIDMAVKRPRTVDEFAAVHGVGRAKLAEFADVLLEVLETGSERTRATPKKARA